MDVRPVGNSTQAAPVFTPATPPPQTGQGAAPVETANAVRQSGAVPSLDQLQGAVKEINKALETLAPGLEFSIDSELKEPIIKVVDQKTKEVLRQIPSEETIAISKALDKLQGILIKQEA
jgi:flagellar protein FlaG